MQKTQLLDTAIQVRLVILTAARIVLRLRLVLNLPKLTKWNTM